MQDIILIIVTDDKVGHLEGVKAWGCFLDELILSSGPKGYWMQKEQ